VVARSRGHPIAEPSGVVVIRAYGEVVRCAFIRGLGYRVNVLLRLVGSLIAVLIQVAIWRSVLAAGDPSGVSLSDMVTYAILSVCVGSLTLTGTVLYRVDTRLRTGDIGVDLVKPISFPLVLAAESLGVAAFQAVWTLLPTFALATLAFGLQEPASFLNLLVFVVSLPLAAAMSFIIGYLTALLAFWALTTMYFEWTIGAIARVFGGSFLPLWFFPAWLGTIANWLPFRYLYYVPLAIYLGRIPSAELGVTLLIGLGWLVVLVGCAHWLWDRSMRRLIVQGG
jgi:ABC-2 type transport system permease protein